MWEQLAVAIISFEILLSIYHPEICIIRTIAKGIKGLKNNNKSSGNNASVPIPIHRLHHHPIPTEPPVFYLVEFGPPIRL